MSKSSRSLCVLCNRVAENILGKPGTIVECMDESNTPLSSIIESGKKYIVSHNNYNSFKSVGFLCLKNLNKHNFKAWFCATRFRKAE